MIQKLLKNIFYYLIKIISYQTVSKFPKKVLCHIFFTRFFPLPPFFPHPLPPHWTQSLQSGCNSISFFFNQPTDFTVDHALSHTSLALLSRQLAFPLWATSSLFIFSATRQFSSSRLPGKGMVLGSCHARDLVMPALGINHAIQLLCHFASCPPSCHQISLVFW